MEEKSKNEGYTYTITINGEIKNRLHAWLVKRNIAKRTKKKMRDITILGTRPWEPENGQELLVWIAGELVTEEITVEE